MSLTNIKDTWIPNLEIGEEAQRELAVILRKQGFTVNPYKDGKQKEADLVIKRDHELLVEVKKDLLADTTGNFAIEYQFRGQPSGIAATIADIFVIGTTNHFYCFKTSDLKDYVRANWKYLKKKLGGDQNEAKLIIIPQTQIRAMARSVLSKEASYGDWG